MKQHRNKRKKNYKTIYQNRYIVHHDTDSLDGWEVNCCSSNWLCLLNNAGDCRLSKKNDDIKYSDQQNHEI